MLWTEYAFMYIYNTTSTCRGARVSFREVPWSFALSGGSHQLEFRVSTMDYNCLPQSYSRDVLPGHKGGGLCVLCPVLIYDAILCAMGSRGVLHVPTLSFGVRPGQVCG